MKDADNPQSILYRCRQWLAPWIDEGEVTWWPKINAFVFNTPGQPAILQFGYLDKAGDRYQYDGAEYQFCGFDELTHFYQEDYEYLFSRMRKPVCPDHQREAFPGCPRCDEIGDLSRVPLRMRSASNPGGRGHAWVKERFKIEAIHGKVGPSGRILYAGTDPVRPHIPSFVQDNPYVDQQGYLEALQMIDDPVTREQKASGDWGVTEDGRFRRAWIQRWKWQAQQHIFLGHGDGIPLNKCYQFIMVDPASSSKDTPGKTELTKKQSSWTVVSRWLVTPNHDLCLMNVRRFQLEMPEIIPQIQSEMTYSESQVSVVCMEYTTQSIYLYQMCERSGLPMKPLTTGGRDKVARAFDATNRMEQGKMYLPQTGEKWLQQYEDEVFSWTGHPEQTDDQVDVTSYAAIFVTEKSANSTIGTATVV